MPNSLSKWWQKGREDAKARHELERTAKVEAQSEYQKAYKSEVTARLKAQARQKAIRDTTPKMQRWGQSLSGVGGAVKSAQRGVDVANSLLFGGSPPRQPARHKRSGGRQVVIRLEGAGTKRKRQAPQRIYDPILGDY